MIAAIASAAAALVVSRVWGAGTIFASAFTPVIVAIVSEILRKPVESDLVKRPISKARSAVTSSTPVVFQDRGPGGAASPDESPDPNEIRIYSTGSNRARTSPRRRLHLKVALITGLIAFVIAALALTLPELIFGQSVGNGDRGTTVFGGGSSKSSSSSSDEKKDEESSGDSTDESSEEQQQDETTPQDSGSTDETTPSDESGSGSEIDPAPSGEQTTPATPTTPTTPTTPPPTTPAPTTPAPTP